MKPYTRSIFDLLTASADTKFRYFSGSMYGRLKIIGSRYGKTLSENLLNALGAAPPHRIFWARWSSTNADRMGMPFPFN